MLFREFNIIAAAAYAAQCAADQKPERLLWDELSESQQNSFMQAVMAVARGEPITLEGPVFEATAKAILGYNGGQGGLALEEIANIGGAVIGLELLTGDEVAERNIRETVVELLNELAERRQSGNVGAGNGDNLWQNPRFRALSLAEDARTGDVIGAAKLFEAFIHNGEGGVSDEAARLLSMAIGAARLDHGDALEPDAERVVELALSYSDFLHEPRQDDGAQGRPVNGSAELPIEQAETVQ